MAERLDPILPQVPVEEIAVHIGKARLCMGDEAEARLMSDGRVGIYAHIRKRFLGIFPRRKLSYLGQLGPVATQILAPALAQDIALRLRIVVLTPEHLATAGPPEIHVSIWGDRRQLAPYLDFEGLSLPPDPYAPRDASLPLDHDPLAEPLVPRHLKIGPDRPRNRLGSANAPAAAKVNISPSPQPEPLSAEAHPEAPDVEASPLPRKDIQSEHERLTAAIKDRIAAHTNAKLRSAEPARPAQAPKAEAMSAPTERGEGPPEDPKKGFAPA